MNTSKLFYALFAGTILFACTSTEKKVETTEKDEVVTTECYKANFEADSAVMSLHTLNSGQVKGELSVLYAEKPHNNGTFKGTFKGDTLFVDYTFTTGTDTTRKYTNPLAFLKKDNELKMGVGTIETSMGRSYFVKDKPIDFEKGKFQFTLKDCD